MVGSPDIAEFKKAKRTVRKAAKHLRRKKKRKTREAIDQYRDNIDSITNAIKEEYDDRN